MKWTLLVAAMIPATALAEPRVTVEADVGVGEALGIASPFVGAGAGGWIARRAALTLRATMLTLSPRSPDPSGIATLDRYRRTFMFVGPSLQYWLDDRVWLGAGVGVSAMLAAGDVMRGWGADLRAGYAIGAFDVSLEITPGYFPTGGGVYNGGTYVMPLSTTTTGIALLVGYQLR
jgi:hypothetical protein